MKKIIALLCLVVFSAPIFALNAPTPEERDEYLGTLIHEVIELTQEAEDAMKQGFNLTGEEERNQHGTSIRESLERAYRKIFDENSGIATMLYWTVMKPVSRHVQCDTKEINPVAKEKLQKATLPVEQLESVLSLLERNKAQFEKRVEKFNGDDNMIGQYILSSLERSLKDASETEQVILAQSYATYQVKGVALVSYINDVVSRSLQEKKEDRALRWERSAIDDLNRFGTKVQFLSK